MAPQFEKAAEKLKNVKFAKVDVDENYELASKFNIRSIPTTLFIKNGDVVDQHTGAMSASEIERRTLEAFQ